MSTLRERAAIVALMRIGRRRPHEYAELVEHHGAVWALEKEISAPEGQPTLLAVDPEPLLDQALRDLRRWEEHGYTLRTVLDDAYPENLREVHDRPPLIFVAGSLASRDARSLAIVGARRASAEGIACAERIARGIAEAGYTVVSGLAAGVDAAAHRAALASGARTVAVLGTGLAHCYPSQHHDLQRRIAAEGALISQFWPDARPSRGSFPLRNGVMSGVTRGTVVIEASPRSGARLQSRLALAHGRPVFLIRTLLAQPWARELAERPGVHVVDRAEEVVATVERLSGLGALVE